MGRGRSCPAAPHAPTAVALMDEAIAHLRAAAPHSAPHSARMGVNTDSPNESPDGQPGRTARRLLLAWQAGGVGGLVGGGRDGRWFSPKPPRVL